MEEFKKSIEIIGGSCFEQVDELIKTAIRTGSKIIHFRNCNLTEEETKKLYEKYTKVNLFLEPVPQTRILVLSRNVKKGQKINEEDLEVKNGQNGITADFLPKIKGKKVLYDLKKGTTVTFGLVDL